MAKFFSFLFVLISGLTHFLLKTIHWLNYFSVSSGVWGKPYQTYEISFDKKPQIPEEMTEITFDDNDIALDDENHSNSHIIKIFHNFSIIFQTNWGKLTAIVSQEWKICHNSREVQKTISLLCLTTPCISFLSPFFSIYYHFYSHSVQNFGYTWLRSVESRVW